jgi:hypothetical protein
MCFYGARPTKKGNFHVYCKCAKPASGYRHHQNEEKEEQQQQQKQLRCKTNKRFGRSDKASFQNVFSTFRGRNVSLRPSYIQKACLSKNS